MSYGYGADNQQGLEVRGKKAYIGSLDSNSFELRMDGHSIHKDKKKSESIGRTIAGIQNDGSRYIYFFCTGAGGGATQQEAVDALTAVGCTKFIMYDGGGSSQMVWDGNVVVSSSDGYWRRRKVPVLIRMDKRN